jgi:hypothetical protein
MRYLIRALHSPKKLEWRDCFLPEYRGPHLKVVLTKVVA